VLGAIERDLRRHYASQYRIVSASSGKDALDTVQQLRRRAAAVALYLVDQRMPQMTGIQFLCQARELYPAAARVLQAIRCCPGIPAFHSTLGDILVAQNQQVTSSAALMGLCESLVPLFASFGSLTVAWLLVALGMRRHA